MSDLLYTEVVMDHFQNPRNVGVIDDADGVGKEGSPVCGDLMEYYIKVEDGRIVDIKFRTFGCGAAVASASMGTLLAKGMTLEEAMELTDGQVIQALGGLPEVKTHCSNLAATTLHTAIRDYLSRHPEVKLKAGECQGSCEAG